MTCCRYYSEELPVFEQWPDLSLIGDGLAFYFRNQKQGAGPCAPASCVWGPSDTTGEHAGGCLAGACAEPTVANVGGEVADIRAWMPPGRPLVLNFGSYVPRSKPTAPCRALSLSRTALSRARLLLTAFSIVSRRQVFLTAVPRAR